MFLTFRICSVLGRVGEFPWCLVLWGWYNIRLGEFGVAGLPDWCGCLMFSGGAPCVFWVDLIVVLVACASRLCVWVDSGL